MKTPAQEQSEFAVSMQDDACFHCGEPLPAGTAFTAQVDGRERAMCCAGCKAVAEAIRDYGLERFYRFRTAPAPKPESGPEQDFNERQLYDDPAIQSTFVEREEDGGNSVSLVLDGVTCPACCWLIETALSRLEGVTGAGVNYSSNRARVAWDPDRLSLGRIIGEITSLGYSAWPASPGRVRERMEAERRNYLRRLALSGLLGMQVMMIAVVLYTGEWTGIEPRYRVFFHWISLALTVPVVLYSAAPFFQRAWRDVRLRSPGMDVPVSLGIGIAFLASCSNTVTAAGPVYFDSVVMFVFLLTLGRYLEFMARKKSVERVELLERVLPAFATRLGKDGDPHGEETVPVTQLGQGDRILVRPGEAIPADGAVVEGVSTVDESVLTGEGMPVRKARGSTVHGGSTNVDSPLQIRVVHVQQDSLIARIHRQMERGREEKPPSVELADRIAARFVIFVLAVSALTATWWYWQAPSQWLPVTVSVLIVTCPCALSLAMPTAFASASGALMMRGVAVINPSVLETIARSTHFLFDKTGTLTQGRVTLEEVRAYGGMDRAACLGVAAALERQSEHPLARAVIDAAGPGDGLSACAVRNYPGEGVTGTVNGRSYWLGSGAFIQERAGRAVPAADAAERMAVTWLADDRQVLAGLEFSDTLREDAGELVAALHAMDKTTAVLSGDHRRRVAAAAAALGIDRSWAGQSPEDKLHVIRALQDDGGVVVMVGDGVNDAPVLAGADASVAMGGGTDLSRASADIVLLGSDLSGLKTAIMQARRTLRVIVQNLAWALSYNLVALPAAAAGYVHPWMAAVGMSLSSLLVVLNSARLGRLSD